MRTRFHVAVPVRDVAIVPSVNSWAQALQLWDYLLTGGTMLDQKVAEHVAKGWAVESRTETQAVVTRKSRIGWFWNVVLSVVTGGLWLLVVLYKVINRKVERKVLTA